MKKKNGLYALGLAVLSASLLSASLAEADKTAAYLNQTTSDAVNEFEKGAGTLSPEIAEVFTPNAGSLRVTKEVRILNRAADDGSTMTAFIRVRLVPVFRLTGSDGAETGLMGAVEPPSGNALQVVSPEGVQIELLLADNWEADWFYRDRIFYYRTAVAPGDKTEPLLRAVTTGDTAAWNMLEIEVLAETIQARQPELAEQAWGVVIRDGAIQSK